MRKLYFNICKTLGYIVVFRDYYDAETLTLKVKNSHIALIKFIGEEDERGYIKVGEVFSFRIR
jgi:hypothetical protein